LAFSLLETSRDVLFHLLPHSLSPETRPGWTSPLYRVPWGSSSLPIRPSFFPPDSPPSPPLRAGCMLTLRRDLSTYLLILCPLFLFVFSSSPFFPELLPKFFDWIILCAALSRYPPRVLFLFYSPSLFFFYRAPPLGVPDLPRFRGGSALISQPSTLVVVPFSAELTPPVPFLLNR